jgi:hypothetical protein
VIVDARDAITQVKKIADVSIGTAGLNAWGDHEGLLTRSDDVEPLIDVPAGPRGLGEHLNRLLLDRMSVLSADSTTQPRQSVDFEDLRVRPFSAEESEQHNKWIAMGVQIALAKTARKVNNFHLRAFVFADALG